MTGQVSDQYRYKGEAYSLIALSDPINFLPEDYGLNPASVCSACWRGFICEFQITEQGLFLEDLYVRDRDDHYPQINGIGPEPVKKGDKIRNMGMRCYRNLKLPVPYTGRILAGREFMHEYYIHMGFQRAWAYGVLLEFVFQEGILKDIHELSRATEVMRKKLDQNPEGFQANQRRDIKKFVENSFSLDYESKFWWIPEFLQEEKEESEPERN